MCAEASTVLRAVAVAVAADFFFNCWYLEILPDIMYMNVIFQMSSR
jgi:hypothetical protein